MMGLRYSPLHVTEFCGEMQGKFKVGLARLKMCTLSMFITYHCCLFLILQEALISMSRQSRVIIFRFSGETQRQMFLRL